MLAVHSTWHIGFAELDQAGTFGIAGDIALDRNWAHFIARQTLPNAWSGWWLFEVDLHGERLGLDFEHLAPGR
jgi:hypothetical protein